jgi:hypothetical protein
MEDRRDSQPENIPVEGNRIESRGKVQAGVFAKVSSHIIEMKQDLREEEIRTEQQRKAIEVYCREVANAFNDAGYDKVAVLSKKAIPCEWTQPSVKEDLFRAVMRAVCRNEDGTPKTSTKQLSTKEVDLIYRNLDKWTGEQFGIHVPFPDRDYGAN